MLYFYSDEVYTEVMGELVSSRSSATETEAARYSSTSHLLALSLSLFLTAVALVPRVLLATRLDMVTDEIVYFRAGRLYFPLVTHLQFWSTAWSYNYEHPPLVKLLIGAALALNNTIGHPLPDLLAARLPGLLSGTLLLPAIYLLGRRPFGAQAAFLAALSLALSPWLSYFSALAYLDMPMTTLITVAFLLIWHARARPGLYPVAAALAALAFASKYTAILAVPPMILYTLYHFCVLERRRPPLKYGLLAVGIGVLVFLLADPAIWTNPPKRLYHSFLFELQHAINGHDFFLAGHYMTHVPRWTVLYILLVKLSVFLTIPAGLFLLYGLFQLVRFHLRPTMELERASALAFGVCWLGGLLLTFCLLNIVVGTHYHLPLAPAVALTGCAALVAVLKAGLARIPRPHPAYVLVPALLATCTSHLLGLLTVPAAEGYTSEPFQGENTTLQVAYPGYRDAVLWLAQHTDKPARVGLVARDQTLDKKIDDLSWFAFNRDLPARFQLEEVTPDQPAEVYQRYDYLIWPAHLQQRNAPLPAPWAHHIIYVFTGGQTTYCVIAARP
ncbi:hypothetical protein KTH_13370 [Thermosporothrix hazakensis]|nr:hypothetical protein KTH_13370 [Thermosporothrix hazakensis]